MHMPSVTAFYLAILALIYAVLALRVAGLRRAKRVLTGLARAKQMFDKVHIPILGIVENMSQFLCPHCGKGTHIFSTGGGEKAAKLMDIAYLGDLPLELKVRQGGDDGLPIVVGHPDSEEAKRFMEIAGKVAGRITQENMRVRLPVLNAPMAAGG